MKFDLKDNSVTNKTLSIRLTKKDMLSTIDKKYNDISAEAKIPGFRKGHIPKPVIDKHYGDGYVFAQALDQIISNSYYLALEEGDFRPLTEPKIEITNYPDLEKGKDYFLEYNATFEVRPPIEIPKLEDFEVVVDKITVSPADIMAKLEGLQSTYATLEGVDRKAKTGDYVSIDLKATVEDKIVDSASGISYKIGANNLLPGLDDKLVGALAGKKFTFDTFLDKGEAAGKNALATVEVISVKEQSLHPLNDDFAKLVSEFSTLAELKKSLKENVKADKSRLQVNDISQKFVEKMEKDISVSIPKVVIEDTAVSAIEDLKRQGKYKEGEKDQVYKEIERNLKLSFIFDKLGEDLDIRLSKEEFSNYIVNLARQYQMPPEKLLEIMEQTGQVQPMLREVAQSKAVNVALGKIKVKDSEGKRVDISAFLAPQSDDSEK